MQCINYPVWVALDKDHTYGIKKFKRALDLCYLHSHKVVVHHTITIKNQQKAPQAIQ